MRRRSSGRFIGLGILTGLLLLDSRRAQASAVVLSDILATNLRVTPAHGAAVFDTATTLAFAQAQNSLGDVDQQFDVQLGAPASTAAAVVWANGNGTAGDGALIPSFAGSSVALPGFDPKSAASVGQGTVFNSFMITGGTGSVSVNFSIDLSGQLQLETDLAGQLAQTEVVFNLLLDGDPLLFEDRLRAIGANSSLLEPFALSLTASRNLQFDTPYSLVLRVDSESLAINSEVPEPSTMTLFGIGLVLCARRIRLRMAGHAR